MENSDDIVQEFLVENYENLDRLDRDLVELEKHPSDREILASIFRTIHTLKGTSGFFGFRNLEAVTHVGESLLARLRDGQLSLAPERTTALLAMVDAVRQMLAEVQATGQDGSADHSQLVAELSRLQQSGEQPATVERTEAQPQAKADIATASAPAASESRAVTERAAVKETAGEIQEAAVEAGSTAGPESNHPLPEEQAQRASRAEEPAASAGGTAAGDVHAREAARESIRVDVTLLDKLMNLVGELVLTRNQILQFTRTTEESNLVTTGQRLNLIATELQENVMKTRMQPIGSIWGRFPRTVRDVALACGKRVRIEMEGQETELDKTLIEAIKDPMTHLVRNAVDHGVERPDERQAAGKGPEGMLKLRAYHEGGQVNIEISDDGAGLNLAKVVEKATQKGLITSDQAARLSDREAANLIFLPGLSTAERVTNVSGRGVGMDVVRTNIERIGGTVDVQSTAGKGTTVKVKIPLTLAIVPALIVTSAGQRFAIPQVSLLELVGLEGEEARKRIEMVHGAPVYRLRGSLLPLVYLKRELGQAKDASAQAGGGGERTLRNNLNIVVLQADGQRFGLLVDEISDTEEIVVKPLSKHLKHVNIYAGAAIMGDGKVALILDVLGLAQHAHVIEEGREHGVEAEAKQAQEGAGERQPLLLFQHGANGRMAIDLGAVVRLEEFPTDAIEIAGDQEAVQYRGQIMPLVRLAGTLGTRHAPAAAAGEGPLQVVVVQAAGGRNVGLVVDRILDIVDETYALDRQTARRGVLGSAVIQRRVTDIVDIGGVIASSGIELASASFGG
jgi:two-component system chemotaxis sensor kinase CheA